MLLLLSLLLLLLLLFRIKACTIHTSRAVQKVTPCTQAMMFVHVFAH
jgi:hypothetical protein